MQSKYIIKEINLGKYIKTSDKFYENIKENNGIKERRCSKCKEWKPENIDNFYMVNKSKPERGFQAACRECSKAKSRKYGMDNQEVKNRKNRIWKRKNAELSHAISNGWKKRHAEHVLEYNTNYRKSEHGKAKFREYGNHRKHEMYDQEWESCKKYFDYKCACCDLPLSEHFYPRNGKMRLFDFHKDHVYCDGKNDLRNCIPLCSNCNNTKKRKTFHEFYNPDNPNYTYEKYHKIYLWLRYDHKKYILPKRRYKNQRLSQRLKEIENSKTKKDK
jgi:hypothetical protein